MLVPPEDVAPEEPTAPLLEDELLVPVPSTVLEQAEQMNSATSDPLIKHARVTSRADADVVVGPARRRSDRQSWADDFSIEGSVVDTLKAYLQALDSSTIKAPYIARHRVRSASGGADGCLADSRNHDLTRSMDGA